MAAGVGLANSKTLSGDSQFADPRACAYLEGARKRPQNGVGIEMPAYQVLYPPYSELYAEASFPWSLLVGYLILAAAAAVWAVLDAGEPLARPKQRDP